MIPGHGPVQKGKEQLELVASVMESVVEQVRAAVARGLTLEQTKKAVDLESFRTRVQSPTFDQRAAGLIERAYLEATGQLTD